MSTAENLIPFPIIPIVRTDILPDASAPGSRAMRLRQSDNDSRLDQELAKSETFLFVDLGLLLDEMLRIGGREFTMDAVAVAMGVRGFAFVGGEK